MIIETTGPNPSMTIRRLLASAASHQPIDEVYRGYIHSANRQLYSYVLEDQIVGCIGVELNGHLCMIKHIAVSKESRGKGIGSAMIQFILGKPAIREVIAETDAEAVQFYRKFGFCITSLGEKYPGVERFHCSYAIM